MGVLLSTTFAPRRRPSLARLFADLGLQEAPADEIVVVVQRESPTDFTDGDLAGWLAEAGAGAGGAADGAGGPLGGARLVWRVYDERGLARSRNRAVRLASTDVLLLADDDLRYPPDALAVVRQAWADHPDADALTFRIATDRSEDVGPADYKRYAAHAQRHTLRSIMRVSSAGLALRRAAVCGPDAVVPAWRGEHGPFDERFGLGARWPSGEENILLADLLQAGGRAWFVPDVVCRHPGESGGSALTTSNLEAKGAMLRRMFGGQGLAWAGAFVARKWLQRQLAPSGLPGQMRAIARGYKEFGTHGGGAQP